jgi:uncharacterized protein
VNAPLSPVSLAELRALSEGKQWLVDQPIADLESLTPVRGHLRVIHHGTALEVTGEAEAIVTLCCARCLQQFNHVLRTDVQELIECGGGPASATDPLLAPLGEDLDDRLDPSGSFDPERWLFEQLSLQLPLVNRCGADCPGPACWGSAPSVGDPRWAALQALSPSSPNPPPTVPLQT